MLKNEKGFTLIEVAASIVIISIVLISIAQLMIQSNYTAAVNNEKLVAIDLADVILERLKAESYVVKDAKNAASNPNEFDITLPDNLMTDLKTYTLDGQQYTIVKLNDHQYYQVHASVTPCPATTLNLANVHVEAKRVNVDIKGGNLISIKDLPGKSKIEGYVEL